MKLHILSGALAIFAALSVAVSPARAAETIDLRGYGQVSAELTDNRAVFTCENVDKADILLGKLRADLFWDKSAPHAESATVVKGHSLTVYSLPGQGAVVIARAANAVVALSAPDEKQAGVLAASESLFAAADVSSRPARPYPAFLDFFDNRALKIFVHPMTSNGKLGLAVRAPFVKAFGLGTTALDPTPWGYNPAPGVFEWSSTDYEVRQAELNGSTIALAAVGGGAAPFWEYNNYPEHMIKASDTTLLGGWGDSRLMMAGAHYESWGMPIDLRKRIQLDFLRRTIERYRGSPALGGWYAFAGAPGLEFGFHDLATQSWDRSADGDESFRTWLRDVRAYDLASLGQAWYGDPHKFARWNDVVVPDTNEFFGQLGPDSFRIDKGWRWRAAKDQESDPPAADAPGWIPVEMPPSQQQDLLPASDAGFFRVTFDAGAWREKSANKAQDVWLVFGAIGAGQDAVRISLNGVALATPDDEQSRHNSFAVRVAGALKDGPNELVVRLKKAYETSQGRLAGPVFLTLREPKRLPYLVPGDSVRYSDFRQWQAWAMFNYHRDMIKVIRKLDPDRPLILSGSALQLFDYSSALASNYGMAVEHTGREAWYHPWWPGLGLVGGFYGAGEESATPRTTEAFERELSWIMFDADSSHSFFWDIDDYIKREKSDGWFTNHRRLLELFGKYLRSKPGVVVYRSAESEILTRDSPSSRWDVGRGVLQSAHYDNGYAGEWELKAGLADGYPVLMDAGGQYMEPDVVEAIRKYVQPGRTFVAMYDAGVHTALQPDSYPISALTGFKPSGDFKFKRMTFGRNLPILRQWEGKQFQAFGKTLDCADKDCVALARWDDGSVAIGYRQVGKGRVVVLGSNFWLEGSLDPTGVFATPSEIGRAFFEQLLTDSGVNRDANAAAPDIWARKMIAKNGLQEWLLAINNVKTVQTGDLWMRVDHIPDQVFDVQTNAPVAFSVQNGGILIKDVSFDAYGVRIFGVKRKTIGQALPIWWGEKTFYWKRTPQQREAETAPYPAAAPGAPNVLNFDSWRFRSDPDYAFANASVWTQTDFDDSSWTTLETGPWSSADPAMTARQGAGLYRKKFALPADWSGKKIILSLYSFDRPIAYNAARFSINGIPVADYAARGWSQTLNYDVTNKLRPGENVLTVRVTGGPEFAGLSGSVWLEARQPLEDAIEFRSGWRVIDKEGGDPIDAGPRTHTKGQLLVRDFEAPANWKGRSAYLELSSSAQWLRTVMLNGKPINYNGFAHPFGLLSRINLTPYLKPGETNELMLLSSGDDGAIQLDASRVGLLPPQH